MGGDAIARPKKRKIIKLKKKRTTTDNGNGVDIVYPFCKYFRSTSFYFSSSFLLPIFVFCFFVFSYTVSGQKCNNWTEESRVKMLSSLDYFFFKLRVEAGQEDDSADKYPKRCPPSQNSMLYKEIPFFYSRHENKEKKSFL